MKNIFLVSLFLSAGFAQAHDKSMHKTARMPKQSSPITATWLDEARATLPEGEKATNHENKQVGLDSDKPLSILFFGFTHCPDVCPLTLRKIKTAVNKLSQADREKLRVVFFSVDPENDTLEALASYVKPLGKEFEAMRVSRKVLDPTLKNMAAYSRKIGSVLSHTELLYFINKEGKWTGFTRIPAEASELSGILKAAVDRRVKLSKK